MKRHLLAAFLSLFATFIAYTTRGGEITYTFRIEVALQNGWNLYGSFTTDGKIGALSSADILNWSIDITNGGYYGYTYTFTPATGIVEVAGVIATASGEIELTVPPEEGFGTINALGFGGSNIGGAGSVSWVFGSYFDAGKFDLITTYITISPGGGITVVAGSGRAGLFSTRSSGGPR